MKGLYIIVSAVMLQATITYADIRNYQTGQTIPGTDNIEPTPNIDLSFWNSDEHNLNYADLASVNLNNSSFEGSWLRNVRFFGTDLTGSSFKSADLSNASIGNAILVGADFSDAIIEGAYFGYSNWILQTGLSQQQFYSTKSYKDKSMKNVNFRYNELNNWNFRDLDLTNSSFYMSELYGADFTNATIRGVSFRDLRGNSMTQSLIYSTRSYQEKDLRGVDFSNNSFSNWDFSGQNMANSSFAGGYVDNSNFSNADLTSVSFGSCSVSGANFSEAVIKGATLYTTYGFTKEQMYSTKSYKTKELQGVTLVGDLTQWDFSGQNLTNAQIGFRLQGANLSDATIKGITFGGGSDMGLTKEMIYSTKSYAERDLVGLSIICNNLNRLDLTGVDLSNQNLTSSNFEYCNFQNANFHNAELTNSTFDSTIGTNADFSGASLKNAKLEKQQFSGSKFIRADLSYANLKGTDLKRADLTGASLAYSQFNLSSSVLEEANFSFSDLRGCWNFTPHQTTILSNSIDKYGNVNNLELMEGDTLTIQTIVNDSGYRVIPVKINNFLKMEEGSTINYVLRDHIQGRMPSYYISLTDQLIPELNGIFELSIAEDQVIEELIGKTFYLINWGNTSLESRYFSDLVSAPNLYCDFTNFYVDGSVTIIPEPATIMLLSFGMIAGMWKKKT